MRSTSSAWAFHCPAWRFVSPADQRHWGARENREVELRGPAVANRYPTMEGIVQLGGDDGWFDTGDLGYLDEQGRVYVCGADEGRHRAGGVNLYPHDIERAAATVDGVRKGMRHRAAERPLNPAAGKEGFVVPPRPTPRTRSVTRVCASAARSPPR